MEETIEIRPEDFFGLVAKARGLVESGLAPEEAIEKVWADAQAEEAGK